mmetsp:Transcript_33740/g.77940  ORF Transcript_33740/g.77940 Transcript_33740/m.77940 type:complete len:177 (-) Transcript_33740:66-596(-)
MIRRMDVRGGMKMKKGKSLDNESVSTASTSSSSLTASSSASSLESLRQLPATDSRLRRVQKKMQVQEDLLTFLRSYGFVDVNEPNVPAGGCFLFKAEATYPVHFAAERGDHQLLRDLIAAGADLQQTTSKGRTALQIAKKANKQGSHAEVLEILSGDLQIVSMKQFRRLAKQAWTI